MSATATPFPRELVREDLRDFAGYSSARTSWAGTARIWLNANEAARANHADPEDLLRRYPDPQPAPLVRALASAYGVDPADLVVGRGSDEAIELLVRALCRPGGDGVVVSSPTFGMYAVSARLHGVPLHDVPQRDLGDRFEVDANALTRTVRETGSRVLFLTTPGNPTGSTVPLATIGALASDLARSAVVVVDEAYQEFASGPSAITLLGDHPNLVVLRTLSKAHALAGARVGVAIGHPDLAAVLRRVQAPYPVPEPVSRLALAALEPSALSDTAARVVATIAGRDRLRDLLDRSDLVEQVYASEANFVLARGAAGPLLETLAGTGIVVRDMRHQVEDAVRVSVGTDAELDEVARALHLTPAPTTQRKP
ncbi:histidinol-phosphate transaminase [Ornithinicoccus hortensis]|uniref:Histidinol-phosphate aminotransferase n=1 Tax=Ornithinicoccus hortensis TaxID=82346 RepID=A0A542YT93_9MICO|nr:histidinol-phosphate transaminase [Ornithinicoccus hortensis]TQL51298.1 histidinol-phosphate aminotransferase [Ornithinicoccus hortensis]